MTTFASTSLIQRHKLLLGVVLLALIVRLTFVLMLDPSPTFTGGDTNWYMENGRGLVTTGTSRAPLPTPPLYLIFLGVVQVVVPGNPASGSYYTTAEMQIARAIQAVMGAALCLFVYLMARRWFEARAGLLAALIMAISPALIIEAGNLVTESLFLFLVLAGLALYAARQPSLTPRTLVGVGILFGLATLTRAVFLLFPLGIVVHLWLIRRRTWGRLALALLASYGLVVSTWTVYNWLEWRRFVVGGEGMLSFVYQGAEGWASPEVTDAQLGVDPEHDRETRAAAMRERIRESLFGNPVGWAAHRAGELANAYFQPHNTVYFGGKSIRDATLDWLRHDRSAGGLIDLTQIEAFWPKLALYLFHYAGLLLGGLGMVRFARRWRELLPLYGIVIYFTGLHLVLLALPRYIFPVYPALWMFGTAAVVQWWAERQANDAQQQGERSAAPQQAGV